MDPSLTIEEFEHAGMHVRVGYDDAWDPAWTNPRNHDGNLGEITMREIRDLEGALGDGDEMWNEREETCERCDGTGDAPDGWREHGHECPGCEGLGSVTIDQLEQARRDGARVVLGVYYRAHGPQHSVGTNRLNLIDDADIGQADGVIFDTPNGIRLHGLERASSEAIAEALASELETWGWFLEGRIYVYEVEDANGVLVDSCGSMLGDNEFEAYAKREAIASAEAHAKHGDVADLPSDVVEQTA